MLNEIIDVINEKTEYRLEHWNKVLYIHTEKGIPIAEFMIIRNLTRKWIDDIRVDSRRS